MIDDFIKDEYREKWNYLRHMEEQGQKISQWYYTIVVASLTFALKDAQSLTSVVTKPGALFTAIFCTIYSIIIALFLILHKKNYKRYNDRILEIENKYTDNKIAFPKKPILTIFRLRYSFPTTIGAGCCAISLKLLNLEDWICILGFVLFLGIMLSITFIHTDDIRSTGYTEPNA